MTDYTLSVDVIGAEQLKAAMDQASGVCLGILKRTLDKTAYEFEATSRANAPHKTGALRSSIHTNQSPGHLAQVTGNNVEAKVGTNISYGRAQEYGTVGMVINSRSRLGTPFQYIGNIKPKFYFKRAKDTIYPKFQSYMQEAVGLIISSLKNGGYI